MLEVKHLSITISHKKIIDQLSFTLKKQDKLAIIGEEGNGKTSLLKALMGTLEYGEISGSIVSHNEQFGYLEQQLSEEEKQLSVNDYLNRNGWQDEKECYRTMKQLNLRTDLLEVKSVGQLSGGEQVKLQLLRILLSHPTCLILDEPTNNLDLETLEWLEAFILKFDGPVIYVSHDETLLKHTANLILHLELTKKKMEPHHTLVRSSYEAYVETRMRSLAHTTQIVKKERATEKKQLEKLNQIKNKVEHHLNTISRSDPHGAQLLKKKMKTIKAQENRMAHTSKTELPDPEEAIHFFFAPAVLPPRKLILNVMLDELKQDSHLLSRKIELTVTGRAHIGIIGNNGVGKTTLLKVLYQELQKRTDLSVGYMPQTYEDQWDSKTTPIEFLRHSYEKQEEALLRSYMGNLKLTREEMVSPIFTLSGGSKAKLFLLKLSYDHCNVLLLDEPTRNVSPLSGPVIRSALRAFQGAIISVSHDRAYLEEVCEVVYELDQTGLHEKKF